MLHRRERLTRARDIARTKKQGVRKKDENFSVSLARGSSSDGLRATVVVSKQVARKAVDRNRIRRQVREVLKVFFDKKGGRQSFDIVVSVKKPALGKSFSALKVSLLKLLD